MDFSYTRSESSGTSMPAEPAESVVREKPCPMLIVDRVSSVASHRRHVMTVWDKSEMSSSCMTIREFPCDAPSKEIPPYVAGLWDVEGI